LTLLFGQGFLILSNCLFFRDVRICQEFFERRISKDVIDLKTINFEQLCRYDSRYFPGDRAHFLQTWINQPHGTGYAIVNSGDLVGYGVIRKAQEGFKIAPLFAESQEIAEKLFLALSTYAEGKNVHLDVPDINKQGLALIESYKMQSMFECVRMYTAEKPDIDWTKIFGVTTLELG
jgi:hypothetical protein